MMVTWAGYFLTVDPEFHRLGVGRLIMQLAEHALLQQGCPKIDLIIRDTNSDMISFYRQIGYSSDLVKVMSKRLITDK